MVPMDLFRHTHTQKQIIFKKLAHACLQFQHPGGRGISESEASEGLHSETCLKIKKVINIKKELILERNGETDTTVGI